MDVIDKDISDIYEKRSGDKVEEEFQRDLERPPYIQEWIQKNTFHHSRFKGVDSLVRMKEKLGLSISLCFPTLNEEETIGKEVVLMRQELKEKHRLIDEIAVVDSGSVDNTERVAKDAGADFYLSSEILPQYRSYSGKGENLWKSLYVLNGDIICWIDADITNIHPRFVLGLVGPLLIRQDLSYIKAFYKRPISVKGELHYTGGGRVTELVVRPFFNLLFPELTGLAQPLSGEYAARRRLLERLPFFNGYGVESGHLIDILRLFGIKIIGQCDLDVRIHKNQNIEALRSMSYRILKILLQRADDMGRIEIFQDISDSLQVLTGVKNDYSIEKMKVWGIERPPIITFPEYRKKRDIPDIDASDTSTERVRSLPYTASLMFHNNLIIPRLKGKTKRELIKEIVAVGKGKILNQTKAKKALLDSGTIVETPIGKSLVFLHGFGDFVDDIIPIIGLAPNGVYLKPGDKDPIHIVFAFLAPEFLGEIYTKIVDSLSRIFSKMEHFEWLLRCRTPDEIIAFISYLEAKNKIIKMLKVENTYQAPF